MASALPAMIAFTQSLLDARCMTAHAAEMPQDDAFAAQIEAVLRTTQVLAGVIARSMTEVAETVGLPGFRVLAMVAARGPVNLRTVATELGVHPSNASRACDRLVAAGLLDRRDD